MKMQSLSLLLFLAIALVATQTDMDPNPLSRNEEQQMRAEAVVHNRRGANGGSDLTTKPSQDKNGALDLPVGVASFCVSMVANCFFFLLQV